MAMFRWREMSELMWAYATAEHPDRKLFESCTKRLLLSEGELAKCDAQTLCNMAYSMTRNLDKPVGLEFYQENLLLAVAKAAVGKLHAFEVDNLRVLLWAFADITKSTSPELHLSVLRDPAVLALFERASAFCVEHGGSFRDEQVCSILGAFAQLQAAVAAPEVFDALADTVLRRGLHKKMSPEKLSLLMQAYSSAKHTHAELFDEVAREVESRAGDFEPFHLAATALQFSDANHYTKSLGEAILKQVVSHIHLYTPHDITKVVLAQARAGQPHRGLFTQAAKQVLKHGTVSAEGFDRGIGEFYHSLVWAYGTVGFAVPPLFNAIARAATRNVGDLSAQQLYCLSSAFAMVPSDDGDDIQQMYSIMAEEVVRRQWSSQVFLLAFYF
jgi:hypothetical protein